jgi:cytochrome c oxidase subunit 3
MSIHTSRTADALPGAGRTATMGTWGLWLTIVVLAMFVAGLSAAALYLHTGQEAWPPEGIERPGAGLAVLATVIAFAGAAVLSLGLSRMGAGSRRRSAIFVAGSFALLTASVIVLIADIQALTFRWDVHAYGSVYWILTGAAATFLSVGVLMTGAVLIQSIVGLVDDERHLEFTNAAWYVWFAALTTGVLLTLVHLLPVTTGSVV